MEIGPFRGCICTACGLVDYDEAFKVGFAAARKVRPKGDFLRSDDGFWCMRENVVTLLRREGVQGAQFKRIADTDWHVVNVTNRLRVSPAAFQPVGATCSLCGRNTEVLGSVIHLGHLLEEPPKSSLFSSVQYNERFDRDVLIDENILKLLQHAEVTGGTAQELLPEAEYQRLSEEWQRGEDGNLPQVFL